MSCPDCFKGAVLDGEPTGSIDSSTGAYFAAGPEGNTSRAVLLFTDIFGLGLKNPRILADNLAKHLECDVWVPDFFLGKAPVSPGYMKMPERPGQKISKLRFIWSILPRLPGLIRQRPSVVDLRFIEKLKSEKKYTRLGAVGYCFGGSMCVRFGGSGLLDSIVICHPGNFSQKDLDAISIPCSWACAEEDFTFSPETRANTEKCLKARQGKVNFVDYEFKDYKGTVHGFAARPNLEIPEVKEGFEQAFEQTVNWFDKTMPK
ncbi:hypothetical protein D9758_002662 [Tetrapyrgos nigripes]|uniref:Dienelactone hydrolase domain-containing protein n=1 Tax=Tetrapyrgos nigripes TaxID=182062 RepID=A0A8H5GR53_9AGAR|nr:hypothetical protein D9758_002662 [Tetrapyrgos nigripes]